MIWALSLSSCCLWHSQLAEDGWAVQGLTAEQGDCWGDVTMKVSSPQPPRFHCMVEKLNSRFFSGALPSEPSCSQHSLLGSEETRISHSLCPNHCMVCVYSLFWIERKGSSSQGCSLWG